MASGKGRNWKIVLGLTGGMGSGKSTVLKMFKEMGATTLDADEIIRNAYKNKLIQKKIRTLFGRNVEKRTGQLDKKKISNIIFLSSAKRKKLEAILHPVVRKTMAASLRNDRGAVAVCDVPLLYEKGLQHLYDKVVVVNSSRSLQLRRLRKRGIAPTEARRRMKYQWPLSKKVKKADFVIDNNGSRMKTKQQVQKIYETFRGIK